MKKLVLTILCATILLVVVSNANASVTLSSVDGIWSNVVGGSGITFPSNIAIGYGNGLEDQVRWGTGTPTASLKSGLGFTGATPPSTTFNIGDTFQVGQMEHFNNQVVSGTAATSADLGVNLIFSNPALNKTFTFTCSINETPNNASPLSNPANDDFITFPNNYPPQTMNIGGTDYTLHLLGFGLTSNAITNQFRSPEGTTNSTLLWGQLTVVPIPAPGAILLGSIGVSIVGWLRRKGTL
jgi:hypothetical protein